MMRPWRTALRPGLGVLLGIALVLAPFSQARDAAAANGSLVIEAMRVVLDQYVDLVQPVTLLNAAIATLRKVTNLGPQALPDIPPGASESDAERTFTEEFPRAVQGSPVNETQLTYIAIGGMLASLRDTHTFFLDPAALRESRRQMIGNPSFTGIGVTITSRQDSSGVASIFIENVFPGSPAKDAGLRRFDKIVQVNGKSLVNANVVDASQAIRGAPGSTAVLQIQRAGQILRVLVVRAPIRVPPIEAKFVQPGVAYLKIFEFTEGTGSHLRAAVMQLASEQPIRSVVLDLRGNPGGLIVEAAAVGGMFLPPRTPIALIKERGHPETALRTPNRPPAFPRTPLVVLTDLGSASASEILTSAFKDLHRATIVGEKTAGALGGSLTVPLSDGSGISVTVERILSTKNQTIEGVGITPDTAVPLTVINMERGEDTQLQAALHALGVAWAPEVQAA